jgi:hypothetical protein
MRAMVERPAKAGRRAEVGVKGYHGEAWRDGVYPTAERPAQRAQLTAKNQP